MTAHSLDRLDRTLATRRGLRLRIVCPSQEFSDAEMSLGTGRWRSCVRGLWELLSLSGHRDLAPPWWEQPFDE